MAHVEIEINTDSAAFDGGALFPEIARILRQAADELVKQGETGWTKVLRDVNGNKVGEMYIAQKAGG